MDRDKGPPSDTHRPSERERERASESVCVCVCACVHFFIYRYLKINGNLERYVLHPKQHGSRSRTCIHLP